MPNVYVGGARVVKCRAVAAASVRVTRERGRGVAGVHRQRRDITVVSPRAQVDALPGAQADTLEPGVDQRLPGRGFYIYA